jgi:cytochrome c oxidase subunit II
MTMPTLASAEPGFLHRLIFGDKLAASEAAAWSDGLFMMITWFSIICFVILMGIMGYFVVKYRRRPGVPVQPSPHHNTLLEIFWTVVPSSSMLVMFVLGFQGYAAKLVSPDDAMELRIQGFKWAWIATYPNGATSPETQPLSKRLPDDPNSGGPILGKQYPIFYIPEDTDVKLRMQSTDVIHSFWIPEFRTKMDVMPNRYTGYGFHTPKLTPEDSFIHQDTGLEMIGRDMWIFCAEYCGDEHSRMAATLRVVPREIYDQKMAEWGVQLPPIEAGEKIWKQICASCHTIDGNRLVGPPWNSSSDDDGQYGWGYDVSLADGSTHVRDANYYRESILDPNAKIVNGYAPAMASYQGQLSDEDIDNLIAFIQSISDRNPNEGETGEGEGSESENQTPEDQSSQDESAQDQAQESAGGES